MSAQQTRIYFKQNLLPLIKKFSLEKLFKHSRSENNNQKIFSGKAFIMKN